MKRTKSGRDLFETWALIKAYLEAKAPLPEDIHEYLLEVADGLDELNEAVRLGELEPRAAADAIPKCLGLTAGLYREWLRRRRDFKAANAFEHQMTHRALIKDPKDRTVEATLRDLGRQLGVTPRSIHTARRKLKK